MSDIALPLTDRAPEAILFRRGAEAITVRRFLAEVAVLAARLPDRPHVLNLCADRYNALLGLAAALSRGQVMLLSADRTERRQREIAALYPGLYPMADAVQDDPAWAVPEGAIRVGGEAGAGLAVPPNPLIPAGRVAIIGFTSGSTGQPGAHPKPWGALVAASRAAAARFGLERPAGESGAATLVATVPAQHMYGFETTLALPLHAATASHAGPFFYPVEVAEALHAAPAPRLLVTTPLQMRALLRSGAALPPLRAVISATAPLDPDLAREAEAAWSTEVLEIYGATEMGSIASRRTVEGEAWHLYDSVALRPVEAPADAADGAADGTSGRMEALVAGMPGPVPLADAVTLAAGGRAFRLLGRHADIVKLGGKRVSLASLNRLLQAVPGVEDGVFLVPEDLDRNPAARLLAFAVAPGMSGAAVLAALRGQVDPVFLPRGVTLLPALPRDRVGKLPAAALAALRRRQAEQA